MSRGEAVRQSAAARGGAGGRRGGAAGFTLIEILLAVSVLAIVTTITYVCFATITTAWKRSRALSDELHHADFLVEQIVTGLRSAYYQDGSCGLWLDGGGSAGAAGSTRMSWVKLGSAIVGDDALYQGSPHRVLVSVERDEDGKPGVAYKAWRLRGQAEDFDPNDLEMIVLCKGIVGLKCRPRDPEKKEEVEWLDPDEWKDALTNKLPTAVELTVTLEPLEPLEDPVEVKRIVEIPVAPLSWGAAASSAKPAPTLPPATGVAPRAPPRVPPRVPGTGRDGSVPPPAPTPGMPPPMGVGR